MAKLYSGRILVVDDNLAVLDVTVEMLKNGGFTVTSCSDSAKALDMLVDLEPDLLITDVCMPKVTGSQLIQIMRSFDVMIPVIIITGYAEVDMVIEALRNNVYDIIKKPFNYEHLLEAAAKAIQNRKELLRLHGLANDDTKVPPSGAFLKDIYAIANDLANILQQLRTIEDSKLGNRHLDSARDHAEQLVKAILKRIYVS